VDTENSLIEAKNITLERNDVEIFSNISISFNKSQITNIHGLNGSGKTSFLKTIIGITEPTSGKIYYVNEDLMSMITYIGHRFALKNSLTVNENLIHAQAFKGAVNQKVIDAALDVFNIIKYKNSFVKNLSHGQQKRVALSKLLSTNSIIWIIDEPYSALDLEGIEIFNKLAMKHIENNGTIIMTSHSSISSIFKHLINFKI
tara:strand:- start:460 stop:1065 length:606 start_codon:yes stop_codon:yes gene_type:complete